jgi:hypothetical protein
MGHSPPHAIPSQLSPTILNDQLGHLHLFLATAPANWQPHERIRRFVLPNGENISCVFHNNLFHISGTDIVRALLFRFQAIGRPVRNLKKFEEGVFSDLRNLKSGIDATLEPNRSEFLEWLYKHNCVRTQKKQKVFFWFSVPWDQLFYDALERDLKREALGMEPTSIPISTPPSEMPTVAGNPLLKQHLANQENAIMLRHQMSQRHHAQMFHDENRDVQIGAPLPDNGTSFSSMGPNIPLLHEASSLSYSGGPLEGSQGHAPSDPHSSYHSSDSNYHSTDLNHPSNFHSVAVHEEVNPNFQFSWDDQIVSYSSGEYQEAPIVSLPIDPSIANNFHAQDRLHHVRTGSILKSRDHLPGHSSSFKSKLPSLSRDFMVSCFEHAG